MFIIKRHCLYIITILYSGTNAQIKIQTLLQILLTFTVQIYIYATCLNKCCFVSGFFLGLFSGGRGQNLLLCKFLLLFYCFRTKFQGEAKVFKGGGQTASGVPPRERKPAYCSASSNLDKCSEGMHFLAYKLIKNIKLSVTFPP